MASDAAGAQQPEITDLQKKTAQAIVNIFETGQVHGDYGKVTLLSGDSGHLTYGRSHARERKSLSPHQGLLRSGGRRVR